MRIKASTKIFILLIMMSGVAAAIAESAERIAPPAPAVTAILGSVGGDFIIADERKYMITSKTVIKNKKGNKISSRLLKPKSKLNIEFTFVEKGNVNVPVANLIKVLSEP